MMNGSLPDRLAPGMPYPLGAISDGLGVNFAVFSANASKIELCIFDARGRKELQRYALPECTDEIWHGYLPDAEPGLLRSEEHTSELQSLMRNSYAVFCLKKKTITKIKNTTQHT